MIDSVKKQILCGIIRAWSAEFVVVRARIHFNKIIQYMQHQITTPQKKGFRSGELMIVSTLYQKKRSLEKAKERIRLFLCSYQQSIAVSIALPTDLIPPRTIPFLLLNGLLLVFLEAILSLALLVYNPLLLDLYIQTLILILPLLLPLDQPHDPLLRSHQVGLLDSLLHHQPRLVVESTVELIQRPPRRPTRDLQLIHPSSISQMIVDDILFVLSYYLPKLLDEVGIHLLFIAVAQLFLDHRYGAQMHQITASSR